MRMRRVWLGQYSGRWLESKQGDAGGRFRGGHPDRRAPGLRDQAVLRSEEAPTLMALGGFEQLTLNPWRAEDPRRRGLLAAW